MVANTRIEFLKTLAYIFLRNGKFEKAETLFRVLSHLQPEDKKTLFSFAYTLLQNNQTEEALKIIQLFPDRDDCYLHLLQSKAFWQLGEKEDAKKSMRKFLRKQKQQQTN